MSVQLTSVSKNFDALSVVKDLSLSVKSGEFVSLVGVSGCGKSTLLRLIAGLVTPDTGEITTHSKEIGFVFQEPTLLPWATVFENIWLPLRLKGISKAEASPLIMAEITRLGLLGFENTKPAALSGGMKMRVSLARALITKPDLLLMDEPFAALDEITRFKLNDDLKALVKTTVIFVTHSIYEAVNLSDRVVVLSPRPASIKGEIIIGEKPQDFRHTPEFTHHCREVSRLLEA
jgi:NitT/TauT family transport system ATP-binding protein